MVSFKTASNNWEGLAQKDAYWAICTDPEKKGGGWKNDEFFYTGRKEIDGIWSYLSVNGWLPKNKEEALDFGCGIGRLSFPLVSIFDRVTGVDVSKTMIQKANEFNQFKDRLSFVHNERPGLSLFSDGTFSFVITLITLQHVPKPHSLTYISEFMRILKPHGIAVFQVPTEDRRKFSLVQRFKSAVHIRERLTHLGIGSGFRMEMFSLPESEVRQRIENGRGSIVGTVTTNQTNPSYRGELRFNHPDDIGDFKSTLFVVRKNA